MAIKRTFGFDEYQKKISEGIEDIGFKRYIEEHEEENNTSVDDLGEGEPIDTAPKGEEAPVSETPVEEPKQEVDTISKPIDTGNREDVSLDEVKLNMDTINGYVKLLSNRVANADKVALDKATKEKVLKLYNIIQGIS